MLRQNLSAHSREIGIENATKAAQSAQLLLQDLQAMNRDGNALTSLLALPEIGRVAELHDRLKAIEAALRDDQGGRQYGREDLEKVVPFADEVSIGHWDDVPAAITGMNQVLAVIRAEHPCQTEGQLSHAVWLSNEAYREFSSNDGNVKKTIGYVRGKLKLEQKS
jgi:hypothetical protein